MVISIGAMTGVCSGILMFILFLPGYGVYSGNPPEVGPSVITFGSAWVPNLISPSSCLSVICILFMPSESVGGEVTTDALLDGTLINGLVGGIGLGVIVEVGVGVVGGTKVASGVGVRREAMASGASG